ncbi:hypothetical protein QJS10_CPB11g02183 [Acorus calamus]|uniref:Outer envelope pore protein 21, chloroplastic-like n=1 Tax=Acorus calamus TaxID=4465 RepID=A0AAV9DQR2_ACOCL|nr:hypothetical protein QJS10_CPB11g02181 [Acorus calamus]KAK1304201.1 hypothetical protein QJS10_CPB11g02183 [Acorus calamus]
MESSLRFGDSKNLRIHAKQKISLVDSKLHLQGHADLDTVTGAPSCLALIFRSFYPEFSASMGVGLKYEKKERFRYTIRGKKAFPITQNGLLSFNVKGRCDFLDQVSKENSKVAAELSWGILNFQRDQDVRIRVGYEVFEKVPYLQIRENNWTLNADLNGRWNVRFDL